MRKFLICMAVITALAMLGGRAIALNFSDGGVALQGILDGITLAPIAGSSSTNVLADLRHFYPFWLMELFWLIL